MAISSSELALTDIYPPSPYTTFTALKQRVESTSEHLDRGGEQQFLAFKNVTKGNFAYIERRYKQLHHARFTYFEDIETLILKVPARWTEYAHVNFGMRISHMAHGMGLRTREFQGTGATRYTGFNSHKEGNSGFINNTIRPGSGFPLVVIEAGLSESSRRLDAEAAWWFAHSKGEVNIVITIMVDPPNKMIIVDKYFGKRVPLPTTRARTRAAQAGQVWYPDKHRTVVVRPSAVEVTFPSNATGPPLTLEFDKVIGRAPTRPAEQDIVLTAPLLREWADVVFV